MATVRSFRAVRPTAETVEAVAALPYDVYNSEEAREVVKDKPLSFLRIDRPETFFDRSVDIHAPEVYKKAGEALQAMIDQGRLVREKKDVFYLYELTMDGRSQMGLVARTSVDEYLEGTIKKHENTRADKEQDRINHVDACDANTGPIFLTYKAQALITGLMKEWVAGNKALFDFVADDGVGHKVWTIDHEPTIEAIETAFEAIEALYIADGHHRAASAVKVAQMRRKANPGYTGDEAFNYFLSVIFPDEALAIMDYNRVVKDLNGLSETAFIEKIEEKFNMSLPESRPIKPEKKGTMGMYLNNRWYLLEAKEGTFNPDDPVASLDVAILQDNLLEPVLGIGDPRTDDRIDFIGGIRGLGEIERRVRDGMTVGFAMYPTSIGELMAIADAGALMPPKSTWFEPKLRSGIFIHLLETKK